MTDTIENSNCQSDESNELTDNIKYPQPDLTYLKEMAGDDEAFFKEIITIFLESGPAFLKQMRDSALAGDFEQLRITAHTLLPQLTFVGLLSAIPDVTIIEQDSKLRTDLSLNIERATKIIIQGIEELKKMV
jgi:hypothetical protein